MPSSSTSLGSVEAESRILLDFFDWSMILEQQEGKKMCLFSLSLSPSLSLLSGIGLFSGEFKEDGKDGVVNLLRIWDINCILLYNNFVL